MGRSAAKQRQVEHALNVVYEHSEDAAVMCEALRMLADSDPVNVRAALQLAASKVQPRTA